MRKQVRMCWRGRLDARGVAGSPARVRACVRGTRQMAPHQVSQSRAAPRPPDKTALKVSSRPRPSSSSESASRPAFSLSLPPGVTATQNEHPWPLSDVLLLCCHALPMRSVSAEFLSVSPAAAVADSSCHRASVPLLKRR